MNDAVSAAVGAFFVLVLIPGAVFSVFGPVLSALVNGLSIRCIAAALVRGAIPGHSANAYTEIWRYFIEEKTSNRSGLIENQIDRLVRIEEDFLESTLSERAVFGGTVSGLPLSSLVAIACPPFFNYLITKNSPDFTWLSVAGYLLISLFTVAPVLRAGTLVTSRILTPSSGLTFYGSIENIIILKYVIACFAVIIDFLLGFFLAPIYALTLTWKFNRMMRQAKAIVVES